MAGGYSETETLLHGGSNLHMKLAGVLANWLGLRNCGGYDFTHEYSITW
jgi:hypothetical protein